MKLAPCPTQTYEKYEKTNSSEAIISLQRAVVYRTVQHSITGRLVALDLDPVRVGGGLYNDGGTVTINNSTVSGNIADANFGTGGGIYNNGGAVTVENHSSITENTSSDVDNRSVLYLDGTSVIGILDGNSAIPF